MFPVRPIRSQLHAKSLHFDVTFWPLESEAATEIKGLFDRPESLDDEDAKIARESARAMDMITRLLDKNEIERRVENGSFQLNMRSSFQPAQPELEESEGVLEDFDSGVIIESPIQAVTELLELGQSESDTTPSASSSDGSPRSEHANEVIMDKASPASSVQTEEIEEKQSEHEDGEDPSIAKPARSSDDIIVITLSSDESSEDEEDIILPAPPRVRDSSLNITDLTQPLQVRYPLPLTRPLEPVRSLQPPKEKLYGTMQPKSNRSAINNALSHTVLPGAVNMKMLQKTLANIALSSAQHFLIMFKDEKFSFRAVYTWDKRSTSIEKISGAGPTKCYESSIKRMWKYDSGSKIFKPIQTKRLGATIDAFAI